MAVSHTCSQSWVTVDNSRFSDDMSDEVTIEQQRKEELAAMVPPSENLSFSENSRRTEQWVDETCRDRTNEVEEGWPNSNVTNEFVAEEGCSRAPPTEEAQPGSQTDRHGAGPHLCGRYELCETARTRDHSITYSDLCLRKA